MKDINKFRIMAYVMALILIIALLILEMNLAPKYLIMILTALLFFSSIVILEMYIRLFLNINRTRFYYNQSFKELSEFFEIIVNHMDEIKKSINKRA